MSPRPSKVVRLLPSHDMTPLNAVQSQSVSSMSVVSAIGRLFRTTSGMSIGTKRPPANRLICPPAATHRVPRRSLCSAIVCDRLYDLRSDGENRLRL